MIGRLIGTGIALALSGTAITGIIGLVALDFLDEASLAKLLGAEPVPVAPIEAVALEEIEKLPALDGARDITFFKEVPVEGLPFSVTTGVKFDNPADLAANLVTSRWCYISAIAADGVGRKIELAEQAGLAEPIFDLLGQLPADQLAIFKMGADALEELARSHCRFDFTSPAALGGNE